MFGKSFEFAAYYTPMKRSGRARGVPHLNSKLNLLPENIQFILLGTAARIGDFDNGRKIVFL